MNNLNQNCIPEPILNYIQSIYKIHPEFFNDLVTELSNMLTNSGQGDISISLVEDQLRLRSSQTNINFYK